HEAGRQAWALKRQAPERLYDEMAEMAVKMRAKARSR
ncbi:short chain dehydrogenase, partial [Pseudomonas syringae]